MAEAVVDSARSMDGDDDSIVNGDGRSTPSKVSMVVLSGTGTMRLDVDGDRCCGCGF